MATLAAMTAKNAWIHVSSRCAEAKFIAIETSLSAVRTPTAGVHRPISSRMPPAASMDFCATLIAADGFPDSPANPK